jgi:hypothetical protein
MKTSPSSRKIRASPNCCILRKTAPPADRLKNLPAIRSPAIRSKD